MDPGDSSTPKHVPRVRGRSAIRENNSIQSPITPSGRNWNDVLLRSTSLSPTRISQNEKSGNNELSYEDESESDEPDVAEVQAKDQQNWGHHRAPTKSRCLINESDRSGFKDLQSEETERSVLSWFTGVRSFAIIGIAVLLVSLYFVHADNPSEIRHQDLIETFRHAEEEINRQEEDFWRNIRLNIEEVITFEQPRSIFLVHEAKAEPIMDRIIKIVSDAALCHITECSNMVSIIEGSYLNTTKIINDYGRIISEYREQLETNGVLIVKNMEQVPGVSAQAFHSFCDPYGPVVKKAFLIFTMKVEKVPEGNPTAFLRTYLSNLWKDIGKYDKFEPLFTRISGTVLPVKPQ